ncbi:MAG TPA: PIN domain-containing protein [Conexibacter sp.]|nr:PIN domain-containing protein [Conexibacter sp.]
MKPLLLDASVWVASLDTTDGHHDATSKLLNTAARGQRFATLDLTFYEVANVVGASWGSPADAHSLWTLMLRACPETIVRVDTGLFELMVALADRHGLSAYDAAYVAAAEINGWTLVSGDHRDLVDPGLAITPAEALAAG